MAQIGAAIGAGLGGMKKGPDQGGQARGVMGDVQGDAAKMQAEMQNPQGSPFSQQPEKLSPYDQARSNYEGAINEPVKKMKPWQDALFKGATIFSNMMNPNNQLPVQGYGRAKHNQGVQRAYDQYAPQRKLEETRQGDVARQSVINDRETDNTRMQSDLQRKTDEGNRKYEMQVKTLDWKKEDKDRYRDLEDLKYEAKNKNDKRNYDLAVQKQKAIEDNYKTVDENRDADRTSREGMQNNRQNFSANQNQIKAQMQLAVKQYDAAVKTQNLKEQEAAKVRLMALKQELGQ